MMLRRILWWRSVLVVSWLMSTIVYSQAFHDEDSQTEESHVELETVPGFASALKSIAASAGSVWNDKSLESAVVLRRAVRSLSRSTRDLSSFFYPVVSSLSAVAQAVSYLPGVIRVLVATIAGSVDVLGRGIIMLGTGVDIGATAIDTVGRSVQTLASAVPSLVTGVVVGGGFLLLLYPGIQDIALSALASFGLMLAGRVAAGARNFVDENSLWSTLLRTLEVFTRKASQDFT